MSHCPCCSACTLHAVASSHHLQGVSRTAQVGRGPSGLKGNGDSGSVQTPSGAQAQTLPTCYTTAPPGQALGPETPPPKPPNCCLSGAKPITGRELFLIASRAASHPHQPRKRLSQGQDGETQGDACLSMGLQGYRPGVSTPPGIFPPPQPSHPSQINTRDRVSGLGMMDI